MLRLDGQRAIPFCEGVSRRDFLHVGSLSFLGLTLSELFSLQARGAVNSQKDVNCIFLFLVGGPPHLDTWDMKPDAAQEIRGPYKPISTNVPGIQIAELFPRMAQHADKYALIRSLYHTNSSHSQSSYLVQTGRSPLPGIAYPNLGCAVEALKGSGGDLPSHVLLPWPLKSKTGGQSAGFLGKAHEAFLINSDPSDSGFRVRDLLPPDYVSAVRVEWRRSFCQLIDRAFQKFEEGNGGVKQLDSNFEQAYRIISSTKGREAFDIGHEPEKMRDRYGRNRFGQSCLLARRLVERGARFVTVNMFEEEGAGSWDIHGTEGTGSITALKRLNPMFDNAFTSLIEDLHERGLLSQTLVVAMGEFGRTPKINHAGGRDHWPSCGTMIFAGGGIVGGQVIGSSDSIGAEPKDRPVRPDEVVASIYYALGINLHTELPGPQGRPIPLVEIGVEPIRELFG